MHTISITLLSNTPSGIQTILIVRPTKSAVFADFQTLKCDKTPGCHWQYRDETGDIADGSKDNWKHCVSIDSLSHDIIDVAYSTRY